MADMLDQLRAREESARLAVWREHLEMVDGKHSMDLLAGVLADYRDAVEARARFECEGVPTDTEVNGSTFGTRRGFRSHRPAPVVELDKEQQAK